MRLPVFQTASAFIHCNAVKKYHKSEKDTYTKKSPASGNPDRVLTALRLMFRFAHAAPTCQNWK